MRKAGQIAIGKTHPRLDLHEFGGSFLSRLQVVSHLAVDTFHVFNVLLRPNIGWRPHG